MLLILELSLQVRSKLLTVLHRMHVGYVSVGDKLNSSCQGSNTPLSMSSETGTLNHGESERLVVISL